MPIEMVSLLQAKLNRPRLGRDLIQRSRLFERLSSGLDGQLILVCAPAGFGKTTLVCSWLEAMSGGWGDADSLLPSAWVTLDENDSDLILFVRYFIAAVRKVFPRACPATLALIQGTLLPPVPVIAAQLSNEIAQLPAEFILVLDDYSNLQGEAVHNLLNELLRYWPQSMHLVLITRSAPPLPLAHLRAKGLCSEIRGHDLRFDKTETAAFMEKAVQAPLRESTLEILNKRIDGWIGGLRMTALSMRSSMTTDDQITALLASEETFTDFFLSIVLSQQLLAVQKFLLYTSILDRFCSDLCVAVIGEIDPAWSVDAILDWLVNNQLFIIPLDDRQEWFRYHHLFQDFLKFRLSVEMDVDQINDLHCRAATWYGRYGLFDQALQHALRANNFDLAAGLMVHGLRDALNREDRGTLERWLRLLPAEYSETRPEMLMIKAWAYQFTWQPDAQMKHVRVVESLLDESSANISADELNILRAQILVLKSQESYFENEQASALSYARQAYLMLPASWSYLQSGALLFVGLSLHASGDSAGARRILLENYETRADKHDTYSLRLLLGLALISLNSGGLEEVNQLANFILVGATSNDLPILKSWAWYLLGVVNYYRNNLDAASSFFSELTNHPYSSQVLLLRDSVAALALIYQMRGEASQAERMFALLCELDLEQTGALSERARSLNARLLLLRGDVESALRLVDELKNQRSEQPLAWVEEPYVTKARVLLASGALENVSEALILLDGLALIAERTQNLRFRLEVLTLQALAFHRHSKNDEALVKLQQATELARPGDFVRLFIDLGPDLREMLERSADRRMVARSLRALLEAIPELQADRPMNELQLSQRQPKDALVEPITRRELEILGLLREPISIKQVARKLDISPLTVKRHSINIYSKLGVNSRWDAVAKAVELGILHSN
jgi:LuxR family maltose regulon positive regulatory protein